MLLAFTQAAFAQNLPPDGGGGGGGGAIATTITPPAEKVLVTPGGVDMRTRQYAYSNPDLALGGDAGAARIDLVRTGLLGVPWHVSPFGHFTHNFDIMLTEHRVDLRRGNYEHGSGTDFRLGVRFSGRTETFEGYSYHSNVGSVSAGHKGELTYSGDRTSASVVYTYRALDGTVAVFRPLGGADCADIIRCAFVSSVTYPEGTALQFEYETTSGTGNRARLRSVTSNHGYSLLFEYDGSGTWNHVAKACLLNLTAMAKPANNVCPAGALQQATYSYGTVGTARLLASWTNAAGETEQYGYQLSGGTYYMQFFRPGQTVPWLTNHVFWSSTEEGGAVPVIQSQAFADGRTIDYMYFDPTSFTSNAVTTPIGGDYSDNGALVKVDYGFHRYPPSLEPGTDPWGTPYENFGDQKFQVTSGPERIVDELGRETTFDYCDPFFVAYLADKDQFRCVVGELRSWTDPEGAVTHLSHDARGNVVGTRRVAKPGSGLPDIVTAATYACGNPITCSKPATVTDANGNVTSWTYDSTHGGVLTQTMPAVGGVHPVVRYSYAQHYAWIKYGSAYITAGAPVWLPATTRTCRTSATAGNACAAGASDEVVTTYEYQAGNSSTPSNLLLKGVAVTADGQTLRTCYGHDAHGRRISETAPNANLASCP